MKDWNLSEARKKFREDLSYALNKFNWGDSALDAKAIGILNTWAKVLDEQDREFIRLLKEADQNGEKMDTHMIIKKSDLDKLAGSSLTGGEVMKDWNLSDKRREIFEWCLKEYRGMFKKDLLELIIDRIMQQDREFIRQLKIPIDEREDIVDWDDYMEFIDKLAGSVLTGEKK